MARLSFRDRVRSSDIQRELGVDTLLFCNRRSQLRWFCYFVRIPPGPLPLDVFRAHPTSRRPWRRPRIHWWDYMSHLAWECLGYLPEELENVAAISG